MLTTYKSNSGVQFDSKLFSEADVAAMMAEIKPRARTTVSKAKAKPIGRFAESEALPSESDIDRALADALTLVKKNPELAQTLAAGSEADAIAEAKKRLTAGLRKRTINKRVVQQNIRQRGLIKLTEHGSVLSLAVQDRTILAADRQTKLGASLAYVIQAIMVVIDVVFVIAAIVGVALLRGSELAKKIAETAKGLKNILVEFCQRFMAYIKKCIPSLRSAQNSSSWFKAVKDACATFGPAIFRALKGAAKIGKLLAALRDLFKSLFAGKPWQIVTAVLSFVGAVAAIITTFGASLVFQLANLVAQVAFLAADVITLATMKA